VPSIAAVQPVHVAWIEAATRGLAAPSVEQRPTAPAYAMIRRRTAATAR
jgi:hypothetical protein